MECLKCFGLSGRGPLIRAGTDFLLASQNADGSWGKTDNEDIYRNYHVTLAATGGLMEVRWRGPRLTFPELKPLLERMKDEVKVNNFHFILHPSQTAALLRFDCSPFPRYNRRVLLFRRFVRILINSGRRGYEQ